MEKLFNILLVVFTCIPSLVFSQVNIDNAQKNAEFDTFLEKFRPFRLPKKFPLDSLKYYNDHQEGKADGSIKMVKTKFINISDSKFLPKVSYNKKDLKLKLLAIYKFKLSEKYWVIIYDRCLEADDPVEGLGDWLILCTFDNSGNRIDSLSLTGYTYESIEQFSEISKEFKIKTHRFEDVPIKNKKNSFETEEILSEYDIAKETGKVIVVKSESRKVKRNSETSSYDPLEPFKPCNPKR